MSGLDVGLLAGLVERGVTRRSFLKFCAAMTAVLALPASYTGAVAAAVAAAPRLPMVWLRGQGCGGETEALLRASNPTTAGLFLDLLSVDYIDALMAPAGHEAESARTAALQTGPSGYIAVIEGAVPTAADGAYLTIGGRPFADIVRAVTSGAAATIALGSCAFDGGIAGAAGGATGSSGIAQIVSGSRVVTLPGCPINVENLTATIVHYLTFKEMPATDLRGRPLFAYGSLIHNQCERRPHFEFGEFVQAWGDEGAQKGWCLYRMGCKGPESFANCPTARYGEGASWPVKAGAGCIGCTMPGFWDAMSPFSGRLPPPIPFAPDLTVDQVGMAAVVGVGGLATVHGAASIVRATIGRRHAHAASEAPVSEPVADSDNGPVAEPGADSGHGSAAEPAILAERAGPPHPTDPLTISPAGDARAAGAEVAPASDTDALIQPGFDDASGSTSRTGAGTDPVAEAIEPVTPKGHVPESQDAIPPAAVPTDADVADPGIAS